MSIIRKGYLRMFYYSISGHEFSTTQEFKVLIDVLVRIEDRKILRLIFSKSKMTEMRIIVIRSKELG